MPRLPVRTLSTTTLLLLILSLTAHPALAAREKLALRYLPVPLPGAPSAVVAADLDGDGLRDLAVVVAFTRWDQIEIEESTKMDDVEGLVEVLTVIPSLVDRREIRVFPGRPDGGFGPGAVALPIDKSVLTLEAGPPGLPVVAMTDDGLSVLRMKPGASGPELSWEKVLTERSVLAGTGTFLPDLGLVRDVDGDGKADLLFPTPEGVAVYLTGPEGLQTSPASRVRFPLDDLQAPGGNPLVRRYPLPELRDVDGDHRPDLVLLHPTGGLFGFRLFRNLGNGRFGEPLAPLGEYREQTSADAADATDATNARRERGDRDASVPVWFGDLDGDGRAEYVTQEEKGVLEDAGFRAEMRAAKKPQFTYRLHRARSWSYGGDVTGDGIADLVTIAENGLRLFAGTPDPRRELLDRTPRQAIDLGGMRQTVTVSVGAGSAGMAMDSSRSGSGPRLEDLDGDGRAEVLLSSPNAHGRGRVVVVRLG